MRILRFNVTDELARTIDQLGVDLGHTVQAWTPTSPTPDDTQVVIIGGLEAVIDAGLLRHHCLAVVEEDELAHLAECPFPITELLVQPVRQPELTARLRLLCARPPSTVEQRHKILGMAVESSADVFELTSPSAIIEYVNPAFERATGFRSDEVKGKTVASCLRSEAHSAEYYAAIDEALRRGDSWSGTLISTTRAGKLAHFESTIAPVIDSKGEITHHVAVKRDITDRKLREQALHETNRALEQARDAAVAASRSKTEFLANMSHELRTPLNAIIGYSEMLAEDHSDDAQAVKDLNRIRSAGSHLLALINDVLDLSKIEANHVELLPESIDLKEFVTSVTESVEPLVRKNNNRLIVDLTTTAAALFTDRTRLRQILLNLLSNACKFTSEGEITLTVQGDPTRADGLLRFHVKDTGIGIEAAHQHRVFDPFVQADSSTTRKYGGTGLGLVISRRFAEMMGGSLTLESEVGVGSTFMLSVPARLPSKNEPQRSAIEGREQPVVLLIDNDEQVQDIFTRGLTTRGFRVHAAATGEDGIRFAHELRPDAIVLDVRMPGMSGWEVLSTLKISERTADIPVIMMTIVDQEGVGKALGAADYLVKPIDPAQLTQTLRRFIKDTSAQILVVEDDESTRDLMCRTLTGAGHSILSAENGKEALEILRSETPDLIVLDLMMPIMDGFTFLDHYHHDESFIPVPTIIATARTLSESERAELLCVADRIIQKGSVGSEMLLETICRQVNHILAMRQQAASDSTTSP